MELNVYDSATAKGRPMDIDELVARITSAFVSESCEAEAIKAFTVMARTELAKRLDIYGGSGCENHKGYDLCTDPGHCISTDFMNGYVPAAISRAAEVTKNLIITYEGKPIKPYFHYRCGGATENSENVMGRKITYLRKVLCSFCGVISDHNDMKYFNIDELEQLLDTKMLKQEDMHFSIKGIFEDIEKDEQGRIKSIKIGNKVLKGIDVMKLLNLNSTRFNYTPVRFLFRAIGTGHGMGLCQCGANEMAKQGKLYDEILNYYYTGIKLEEMQMPDASKPLKGRLLVIDAGYGGEDCSDGKGPTGLREKDINLEIVLELAAKLEKDGAKVHLTRDKDINLPMFDRAMVSNSIKPDFFISVLQNTFASPGVSGTEIYYFRGDKESEKLARIMMDEIVARLNTKNRGVRTAEFYLLREVKASSVIVQLLYITNPQDEQRLADREFRKEAANALYEAVKKYFLTK
ncbi:MAG: N-acetylmuramoyl-L-alanine amidase [Bacillota bacterium]